MKIKNLEFNNQLEMYKKLQISKYKFFNIDEDILEKTFDEAIKQSDEENEIVLEHDKLVQKYIVNQISNGDVIMMDKVINYFTPIKTIIVKNKKYDLAKDKINNIYYKAIQLLKYIYNDNISINMNILSNMKYIINNNYIDTPINKMDFEIYDITILKQYIRYMNIDPNKFANELGISNKELSLLLNGSKKGTIDFIETLCIYFEVENYEELLEKINKLLNSKRDIDYKKIREKLLSLEPVINNDKKDFIVKKDEKCYNLSFMKEYVSLYNVNKVKLCELFSCGINRIDDVLNGRIWMKESLMTELYIEFKVKNFLEFKAKILAMIKFSKQNNLKTKLKIFYEKYKNVKIKSESMIDMIPKDVLSEILNIKEMNQKEKNITRLLFKIGIDEDYTYDEISKILDIDIEEIAGVHREDLHKINSVFEDIDNSNKKVLKKERTQ